MYRWLIGFIVILLLSSASIAFAQSTRDGDWRGVGNTPDGQSFEITLTIENDSLAGIVYRFTGKDGLGCFGVEYTRIPAAERVDVTDNSLNANLGSDVILSAQFQTDETASGHMTVHWHDRQPRCNGDYEIEWTATRQAKQTATTSPSQPVETHPFQTFFQILIFGLSNGSVLALNAIGVTLIYSTVRTLNLAHGDIFALTTALVTSLVNMLGITPQWAKLPLTGMLFLVLLASAGLGASLSMGVEQLGFKPFRGGTRLAPMIATLGLSFILYQAALVWRTFQPSWIPGEHRSVPGLPEVPTDGIPNFLPEINLTKALGFESQIIVRFADVFVILMAFLFVWLAVVFLQKTKTGRAIRALSQDQRAAEFMGVNINQTITRAFSVGGAFAGSAAFIFALYYGRPFGAHGAQSGLLAFAAALLGGIGSPVGALISGLSMGVVSSLSDYYLKAQWTPVLLLSLLLLLLAWRPSGLASSGDSAESILVRDSVILTGSTSSRGPKRLFVLLCLFAAIPLLMQVLNLGGQTILRNVGIFMLLALGLNIALGLAGLLDFGFAAGFGAGAYVAALLSHYDLTLIIVAAIFTGALFGLIKGLLARRLRGDFFAVATLTFGLLARQVIVNLKSWTGGSGGLGGIASPHFLDLNLLSPTMRFYLVFGFVLLGTWLAVRLTNSRTGRTWVASSEDESAALSVGVNVHGARMSALLTSSIMAAVAGALFAVTFSYIDPEITMSFHVSALILTMAILGGTGDVTGVLLGAAVIVLYDKVIVGQIADWLALLWPTGLAIGSTGAPPDIRGAAFFNFGIALYLTVLLRARKR